MRRKTRTRGKRWYRLILPLIQHLLAVVEDAVLISNSSDDSLGKSHKQLKRTRVIDYEIIIDFRVLLGLKKSIALVVNNF